MVAACLGPEAEQQRASTPSESQIMSVFVFVLGEVHARRLEPTDDFFAAGECLYLVVGRGRRGGGGELLGGRIPKCSFPSIHAGCVNTTSVAVSFSGRGVGGRVGWCTKF